MAVQMVTAGYNGKDFWRSYILSLQWQSERVMHDESGEHEIKSCNSKMRLVKSDSGDMCCYAASVL